VTRFVLNGETVEARGVSPSMTMLDFVREKRGLTGTKEGCAEGDCGACTVVRVRRNGAVEAVNACLMQIGQADGEEILTVEGLEKLNGGAPVPVQQAMAEGDGTQCGFCTPGFVGALFALGQTGEAIDDETIHDALAGNLCRCTGYRPIVEAARAACRQPVTFTPATPSTAAPVQDGGGTVFHSPATLSDLIQIRAAHPDAMLLAGGTDLGLSVSKERKRPPVVISTANVAELRRIEETEDAVTFGAAVTYTEALPLIAQNWPSFARLIRRIGSRQIRNLGTIGGNVGNASPIGDTPPCLIALGATLTLAGPGGTRELATEDFFLDYRKTALRDGEVIRSIHIPKLKGGESFRVYKVSKRYDQDISAVVGAFRISRSNGSVASARIAFGGMAATPKRAAAAEAALGGADWTEDAFAAAGARTGEDFSPIDDHRATAGYRGKVAANIFLRLFRDLDGASEPLEVVQV
jgi:xanthine dehydrogenase small subunit